MKLKNKILTALGAAAAATSVVTPLVLTTGCSCGGENSNTDYGVDVTEGYTADEKYLLKGEPVKIANGADTWFNYVKDHTDAPAEEAKWSGGYLATKTIPGMAYSSDTLEIKTKVSKVQADLKNFKVDSVEEHRASYDISGYYDFELFYNFKKPVYDDLKIDPVKLHFQVGFQASAKNVVLKVEDCSKITAIGMVASSSLDPWYRPSMTRMGYDVWSVMPDVDHMIDDTNDDKYSLWVKTEGTLTTYNDKDQQLGVYGLDYERTINKDLLSYLKTIIILSGDDSLGTMILLVSEIFETVTSLCGWRSFVLSETDMIKRMTVGNSITWNEGTTIEHYKLYNGTINVALGSEYTGEMVTTTSEKLCFIESDIKDEYPEYYTFSWDNASTVTVSAYVKPEKTEVDHDIQLYFMSLSPNYSPKWIEGFNIPAK